MTVSLTLFTTCKSFQGQFATIQRNALRSWKRLCPPCEVLVFGNEAGVGQCCDELGFKQIPEIARSKFGTPLLSDLFRQADHSANNDYLAYVNADIILTRDLMIAAETTAKRFQKFLLIARRWNVGIESEWDFQEADWELKLRDYVANHGTLEPPYGGVDLFLYPRAIWDDLPPFAVGRTRWDSALIHRARQMGMAVIDATDALTSIHQNHDYSHNHLGTAGVFKGPEAITNEKLLGGEEFIFTPLNATHVLTKTGLHRNRTLYPPYLLRKLATLPALHRPLRPLVPMVRYLAPVWRSFAAQFKGAKLNPQSPSVIGKQRARHD
jgi:hypothetical protein